MPFTSVTTSNDTSFDGSAVECIALDHVTLDDDVEFARGAARYLRRAGLSDDAIAASLVDELGIDLTDARTITLTL